MEKLIRPVRLAVMAVVTVLLIAVSVVTLYKLQVVEGRAYYEESRNNIVTNKRVTAARGSIMDRYGRVLVQNRVCNNLIIDTVELFRDDDPDPRRRSGLCPRQRKHPHAYQRRARLRRQLYRHAADHQRAAF